MEIYTYLFREMLWLAFLALAPFLVTALICAVVFSLVGSFFQIQDSSFTQIPKVLALGLVMMIILPWEISLLADYFRSILSNFYL